LARPTFHLGAARGARVRAQPPAPSGSARDGIVAHRVCFVSLFMRSFIFRSCNLFSSSQRQCRANDKQYMLHYRIMTVGQRLLALSPPGSTRMHLQCRFMRHRQLRLGGGGGTGGGAQDCMIMAQVLAAPHHVDL